MERLASALLALTEPELRLKLALFPQPLQQKA